MPHEAKTHDEFVKLFCICCFQKSKDLRFINCKVKTNLSNGKHDYCQLLKMHIWQDYASQNPDLPVMICSKCRKKLLSEDPTFKSRPSYEGKCQNISTIFSKQLGDI